jgi:hypothetical protein
VGARLDLDLRWQGERVERLLDERHAATVDTVVQLFRRCGWDTDVEVSFSIYGERGSIDVVGRHAPTGMLAVVEVKASIPNVNQTVMGLDRKARLAPEIADERGWPCRGVARFLIVADGSTSRDRVARHATTFDAALPLRGRACIAWLRRPETSPPRGLFFVTVPRDSRKTGMAQDRVRAKPPESRLEARGVVGRRAERP